ncbi:hypothetical protein BACCIP111895_01177 [Neobacillus rhizosphaerae]|uniref:YozE SAM-like domain-containing protein n=1 Tax=Neobacillus rhizosphaerae TaxID=2880965 RepID=A0ABN8KKT0_9BACI|nr:hypothetical protein [Neobacillus rhizosphaerae]CAH2714023.1 hypothetical protein BACCIP111895_01177 [Neobacillus rhizosphaerae]
MNLRLAIRFWKKILINNQFPYEEVFDEEDGEEIGSQVFLTNNTEN